MLLRAFSPSEIKTIKAKLLELDSMSPRDKFIYTQLNCMANLQETLMTRPTVPEEDLEMNPYLRKELKRPDVQYLIKSRNFERITKINKSISDLAMSVNFSELALTPIGITKYYDVVSELTDAKSNNNAHSVTTTLQTEKILYCNNEARKSQLRYRDIAAPYERHAVLGQKEIFDDFWRNSSAVTNYMQDLTKTPSIDLSGYIKLLNNANTILKTMRNFIGNMHTKYLPEARAGEFTQLTPFNFWGEYNRFDRAAAQFCRRHHDAPILSNRMYVARAIAELEKIFSKEVMDETLPNTHKWAYDSQFQGYSLYALTSLYMFSPVNSSLHVIQDWYIRNNKILRGACALRSSRVSGLAPNAIRNALNNSFAQGAAVNAQLRDAIFEDEEDELDNDIIKQRRYTLGHHYLHTSALLTLGSYTFAIPTVPNQLQDPRVLDGGIFGCDDLWKGFNYRYQVISSEGFDDIPSGFKDKLLHSMRAARNYTVTRSHTEIPKILHECRKHKNYKSTWYRHNYFEEGDLFEAFLLRVLVNPVATDDDSAAGLFSYSRPIDTYNMTHYEGTELAEYEYQVADNSIYNCRQKYATFHATTLLCNTPNIFLPLSLTRTLSHTSRTVGALGCGYSRDDEYTPELSTNTGGYNGFWNTEDEPLRMLLSNDPATFPVCGMGSNIGSSVVHTVANSESIRSMLLTICNIRQLCNFCAQVMDTYTSWIEHTFIHERYKNDIKMGKKITQLLSKYGSDAVYDQFLDSIDVQLEPYGESLDF